MHIPLPPVPISAELAARALEFLDGKREAVEPRDAATVILMRDGDDGPDVYLMERQASMAFASGMWVFPGGGVSAEDGADGRDPIVAAALRETEEETGVVLGADDIHLWDAWTTPLFEPRRYRTWFFVARLPEGQEARDISTESRRVAWLSARHIVEQTELGEMALLPPTYLNLLDIARHDDVEDVFATARSREVRMFTPSLEELEEGYTLTMPEHLRPLRMARIAEG